jgi:hypothetical protein
MVKRLALGLTIVIIVLGMIFLALDILDINEDYRLLFPIPMLNTLFIFTISVLVAYMAAKSYNRTGSPMILVLGGATLALGTGSLFKSWMVGLGLDVIITVDESAALVASILHFVATNVSKYKLPLTKLEPRWKSRFILIYYLAILVSIAVVILLVLQGIIPSFREPIGSLIVLRSIVRSITAVFFLVSAVINLINYYKLHTDFYCWYSLGLMLFGFGIFFISQGAVESKVAWLGRIAQYFGGIYFLFSVLVSYHIDKDKVR